MKVYKKAKMPDSKYFNGSTQIKYHHVGTLVPNIENYLEDSFWELIIPTVYDPIQKSRLCLVSIPQNHNHLVELIEPVGAESPIYSALKKGQKLHHLCFETQNCKIADEIIQKYRFLQVTDWQSAVLFEQRPVRFVYSRYRELLEFLANE